MQTQDGVHQRCSTETQPQKERIHSLGMFKMPQNYLQKRLNHKPTQCGWDLTRHRGEVREASNISRIVCDEKPSISPLAFPDNLIKHMTDENIQNLKQKKMSLAASEHAPIIIELMKDCMTQNPIVDDKSQWRTIVNAITLEVQGTMLREMVDYLENIRKGSLHEKESKK